MSTPRIRCARLNPRTAWPLAALLAAASLPAHALPSFARQTGEECASCHVGAFGPQLTPHGMKFKLGGYTDYDGKDGHLPLSAMLVGSYGHTRSDSDPGDSGSNNKKALQEASLFLAGRWSDHIGSFIQATTASGAHGKFSMDNVDVRFAYPTLRGDKDLLLGLSLNNNPTVQDVLNTVPAWRFPYMSSEMVSAQSVLLDGGLGQQVLGLTGYALWDNSFYGELGGYRALSQSFLDNVNVGADLKVKGTAPYWRLGYMKDLHTQSWSLGMMVLDADVQPGFVSGSSDKYRDFGLDASYQYLGDRRNILALNTSYVHERQTRDASLAAGAATNLKGKLNRFDLSGSWHYDQTWGLTASYFNVNGDADATLYGSTSGKPNSSGHTLQGDWTPWGKESSWGAPWANLRLGLQYTWYSKFLGDKVNYDGSGRNASDNNTLYAFVWTSF
jgi:hypothetical protein